MKTDSILTKREAQVAELCVKGYIGKEIADKLNTSYRTVVNHFQNIYDKTGIRRSTNALVSCRFAKLDRATPFLLPYIKTFN